MAQIKPFACIRPRKDLAAEIAALPYDVMNRAEAKEEVKRHKMSFLRIDRAETNFPDSVDTYAPEVYKKAGELLWKMVADGEFVRDSKKCFYIYELTMNGRAQTGIVACASIDDYLNNVIKKHENTRAEKEEDRVRHVDTCNAQTGPIFLAYRDNSGINAVVSKVKALDPEYDFTTDDGIRHRVWIMSEGGDIEKIEKAFAGINEIYIADGHHRCASAVRVGLKRRDEHPGYTGAEEFNFFLSVLFPESELKILDYNRVVKTLGGLSTKEFMEMISGIVDVCPMQGENVYPEKKGEFSMYLEGKWYGCAFKAKDLSDDPVKGLDVSLLQDLILEPVLGIHDPKTDPNIDFVGGIRGYKELEKRCATDCKAAFLMYPTDISELFAVADAGMLMPPKSTWFEPKLRSGLFIHEI